MDPEKEGIVGSDLSEDGPLPSDLSLPRSPQIILSSKDLQSLENLERILQTNRELNLTVIDTDVYVAQAKQSLELEKEKFQEQESVKASIHRRRVEWVDNIFLKGFNISIFAAGIYLVTHGNPISGNFLLAGALYSVAKGYVMKFSGLLFGKEDKND